MSQPSRRNPPRERRSALEEALYYFNGEGISSPDLNASHYDMEDSDDTLPSREPMRVEERYEALPSDRLANLDRAVALLIQHTARLSRKMDLILDSNRRLHGRLRELETKVSQRTPAPEATPLPQNPIKRAMRTAADFKQLNNLLEDNEIRNQLAGGPFIIYSKHKVSFLSCLGGNNLDDFVKRIFFALFEDETALHVNFKGRKMKYSLCNSAIYKVVLDVFSRWNRNYGATLSELEMAFTKRLKRSLDNYVQRRHREISSNSWTENNEGCSTSESSSVTRETSMY
ncbi:hypothetical protein SprV_0301275900 [Sparganum proliferum]